jgi:threonine dehydrogenase-like Zn-dependent dehydrogenase
MASAWVFSSAGQPLELHTGIPLPTPATWALLPGEVLLRLDASCVCGSDLHTFSGKRSDPAAPLVLGHEGMGTVVASAHEGAPVGSALTWALAAPQCALRGGGEACEACSAACALPQKCACVLKYGHAPWPRAPAPAPRELAEGLSGCFASHVLLRAGTVLVPLARALAAGVPASALASVNCAGGTALACWRAAQRHLEAATRGTRASGRPSASRVLIFGAGLLGLYLAAAARRDAGEGATVCVVDVSEARLALAAAFGATHCVRTLPGAGSEAVGAALAAALPAGAGGGGGFDAAFEVCGQADVVAPALRALRAGGALVLAGMVHPASALAGVTGEAIIRKCAAVVGVHNYEGADLEEAVELLLHLHASGALPEGTWGRLFSPAQALGDLPAAMALAGSGEWARVVLAPTGSSA